MFYIVITGILVICFDFIRLKKMLLFLGMVCHLFRHLWFFKPLQESHGGARDKAQGLIQHCFSALTIRCCGIGTPLLLMFLEFPPALSFYQVVCFVFSTKDQTQCLVHGRLAFYH